MKKLLGLLFVLGAVIGLSACTTSNVEAVSPIEIYAFSALSSVELLVVDDTVTFNDGLVNIVDEDPLEVEDALVEVNKYLNFIELFLSGEGEFDIVITDSDDPEYDQMATITCSDLLDESRVFVIYFTQEALDGVTEITDENIDTIELSFEGKLIIDEVEYFISATRTLDENDEFVYSITTSVDEETYVEITNYQEGNLYKYQYRYMKQNQLQHESEMEVTPDGQNTQVKLSFTFENKQGTFQFNKSNDNEGNYVNVNYTADGEEGTIQVRAQVAAGNTYRYNYQIETNEGLTKSVDVSRGRSTTTEDSEI